MKLLYYEVLRYRQKTLKLMNEIFDVISIPDPRYDTNDKLGEVDAILAPLGFYFGKEKIDKCKRLRVIGSNTTGEPHIDREYAQSKGIEVVSLMNEQQFLNRITPTAEHTMGLLLAVTRHIPWAFDSVLSGTWNRRLFGGASMLSRMSIGIVGLGRLGTWVARYATAFQMQVCYYDPYVEENPSTTGWNRYSSLEDMVGVSDVVSLHVPACTETRHLISRKIFNKFKPGSVFINTARGECIDEDALLEALSSGHISAAGIDVLDGEFNPDFKALDSPLVAYAKNHENLLITPHIGGSTEDAWYITEELTLKKMFKAIKEI